MRPTKRFLLRLSLAVLAVAMACSINVKKEADGQDKQVDINTPLGGIHVSKAASAEDVGLPVYPGARPKPKDSSNNDKSANVNISGFGYGVKVVALQYESDDAPSKLITFYKNQLKKYGSVLECHTSHMDFDADIDNSANRSQELTCTGDKGNNTELKVGTKENQHIVAVESEGKGATTFSLVYVRTHGKEADI